MHPVSLMKCNLYREMMSWREPGSLLGDINYGLVFLSPWDTTGGGESFFLLPLLFPYISRNILLDAK